MTAPCPRTSGSKGSNRTRNGAFTPLEWSDPGLSLGVSGFMCIAPRQLRNERLFRVLENAHVKVTATAPRMASTPCHTGAGW